MTDTFNFKIGDDTPTQEPEKKVTKSLEFDFKGKSVYIACPCHDFKLHLNTVIGLLELKESFVRYGINGAIQTLGGSALIDRARTDLVGHYLRSSEADYFFFLDSDVGFEASDFLRLMAWLDDPEIDMVSGAYPSKVDAGPEGKYFINADMNEEGYPVINKDGLLRVNGMGLGFCMIKREVLVGMEKFYADQWFMGEEPATANPVKLINFFLPILDNKHTYWGEDLSFFIRAAAAGYSNLYVDMNIALQHVGRKVYTGNVAKALTDSVVQLKLNQVERDNPFADAIEEIKNATA
tara:strand:+ start:5111 stop:5992 length:882 start_codon:yes stop_codon:yes gene_type:complete